MSNMEKVLKGLECCHHAYPRLIECPGCPYEKTCYHRGRSESLLRDAFELLKEQQQKKSKEEVLLAIIGEHSYTDIKKFKQLEELNDEYFNGMLDSIRAVEKLFDTH